MCLLWTVVATPMLQRLKLLKDLLGLYLSRRQAMALLERIQASNLSDDDRNRVNQILRLDPQVFFRLTSQACSA